MQVIEIVIHTFSIQEHKKQDSSTEVPKSADGVKNETVDEDDQQSTDKGSPSPAMEIKGLVRGEPDNGGLQSQGGNLLMEQSEVGLYTKSVNSHFLAKGLHNSRYSIYCLYFVPKDSEIQGIINSGDMERLASLVLNGEGSKLVGAASNQQEIQAFLDNVPAYMVNN